MSSDEEDIEEETEKVVLRDRDDSGDSDSDSDNVDELDEDAENDLFREDQGEGQKWLVDWQFTQVLTAV